MRIIMEWERTGKVEINYVVTIINTYLLSIDQLHDITITIHGKFQRI